MIGISACLFGINCRYNGISLNIPDIEKICEKHNVFFFCPEQLGGLSTPRTPSEIQCMNPITIKDKDGIDRTSEFKKGVMETIRLIKFYKPHTLILKSKSPSCGIHKTYDGNFSGKLVDRSGILVDMLKKENIDLKIITENEIQSLL